MGKEKKNKTENISENNGEIKKNNHLDREEYIELLSSIARGEVITYEDYGEVQIPTCADRIKAAGEIARIQHWDHYSYIREK
ncbi:hypothetical protein Barb7_00420 [Bacteroidales bacterium Barb7]|nr:hypothetical protein Barb7_00420 [Bacteroidales bacterium Barb7]